MSRTYRNTAHTRFYRHIRTVGTKRAEAAAADALRAEGFTVRPRVAAAQSDKGRVPNAYVDRPVAAWAETDHATKAKEV